MNGDPSQPGETNLTLGEFLRIEREKRGITVEQVASATKVGIRLLQALESDHYYELPARPFIRGFITAYSRFIGLDPKEILTRYGQFIDNKSKDRPQIEHEHGGYAFERKDRDQSRTILGLVMGAFIILGGLVLVFLKPSLKHHSTSHVERLKSTTNTTHQTPSPTSVPAASTGTESKFESKELQREPTVKTEKPSSIPLTSENDLEADPLQSGVNLKPSDIVHRVSLRAIDSIWVRFKVDQKLVKQFIVRKDNILVLRAKSRIQVQVSHPENVTYNYNRTGSKPFSSAKNLILKDDGPTMVFEMNTSKVEDDEHAFEGLKSIHEKTVPPPRSSVQ